MFFKFPDTKMSTSLKLKLIYTFTLISLLVSINGIWTIVSLRDLSQSIDNIMQFNYNSIVAAQNMNIALERQDSAQLAYMFNSDSEPTEIFIENQQEFLKWFSRAEDNITEINEKEIIFDIIESYKLYLNQFNTLVSIQVSEGSSASRGFYYSDILPTFEQLKDEIRSLQNLNQSAMLDKKNKAHNSATRASILTLGSSLLTLILIAMIGIYATGRIVTPIKNLIDRVRIISTGDYSKKLSIKGNDEVTELSKEFNVMLERLRYFESINIKRIMEESKKSEAIVKSIEDPMIVTDKENNILLLNEAAQKLFSSTEEGSIGKHFLEIIKRDDIFDNIKNSMKNNIPSDLIDIDFQTGNSESHFRMYSNPIKDEEGSNIGVITILQDITKLKEVDNLKSEFVSTVSHEFRTPLTSIIMGTDLILNKVIGDINEDQTEMIRAIKEDGERLKTLVNDLLDLSKMQSGKTTYDIRETNLYDIIEASYLSFSKTAKISSIKIEKELDNNLPMIHADSSKLQLVINNLLSNAIKFTPHDGSGKILIKAYYADGFVYLSIEDNGPGIPYEYRNKIFDKFVQIPNYETKREGSGLGLSICKEIITAHKGTIWVEESENHGSKFIFSLKVED